jgi:hypothetical protein
MCSDGSLKGVYRQSPDLLYNQAFQCSNGMLHAGSYQLKLNPKVSEGGVYHSLEFIHRPEF